MASLNLQIPEPIENEENATKSQKDYIRSLAKKVGAGSFPEETLEELGKWQASSILDQLESFEKELAGDKDLDMSKLSGLDEPKQSNNNYLFIIAAIVVVAFIAWILIP